MDESSVFPWGWASVLLGLFISFSSYAADSSPEPQLRWTNPGPGAGSYLWSAVFDPNNSSKVVPRHFQWVE